MASPQLYNPALVYIAIGTGTWGSTPNSTVVTDVNINSTTLPVLVPTSLPAGRWYVSNITPTSSSTSQAGVITVTAGSFTITSSDPENSATTFDYKLL